MRTLCRLTALALATGLAACVTIDAHHEYDRNARFDEYGTFAWITEEPILPRAVGYAEQEIRLSPMLEQEIRSAVERNFVDRGYEKRSDPEAAELIISFSLGTRERIEVDSYPSRAGYHYGPGPRGGWASDVYQYTEGTLAIDIFDADTDRAVWHGWATGRVDPSRPPEERKKRVDEVIDAILIEFPARNPQR
jgi:hypothetical protein